jgi:hypothetical protein
MFLQSRPAPHTFPGLVVSNEPLRGDTSIPHAPSRAMFRACRSARSLPSGRGCKAARCHQRCARVPLPFLQKGHRWSSTNPFLRLRGSVHNPSTITWRRGPQGCCPSWPTSDIGRLFAMSDFTQLPIRGTQRDLLPPQRLLQTHFQIPQQCVRRAEGQHRANRGPPMSATFAVPAAASKGLFEMP